MTKGYHRIARALVVAATMVATVATSDSISLATPSTHKLPVRVAIRPDAHAAPRQVTRQRIGRTTTVTSFNGQTLDGWIPPDDSIAVGPTDVVQVINAGLSIWTKTGKFLGHTEFSSFFAPATGVECIDPVITYSTTAARFALVCGDINSANETIRFAISKASNPTQGWKTWSGGPGSWVDQPTIEIAKNVLVITGTLNGQSPVWVYQLSDLLAGDPNPRVAKFTLTVGVQRAVTELTGQAAAYLVQAYPGDPVYLTRITGQPATKVAHTTSTLGTDTFTAPREPIVPGGTIGGGDLDGRVTNATFDATPSGALVIQFSQMIRCPTTTLDCVSNNRLTYNATTKKWTITYLHSFGVANADATYGAVTVDNAGQTFEAFVKTTPMLTPEAGITTNSVTQIVRTSAANTTSCESGQTPPCDERWGDYLGAAPDPSNPNRIWLSGMYQTESGDTGAATVITSVTLG